MRSTLSNGIRFPMAYVPKSFSFSCMPLSMNRHFPSSAQVPWIAMPTTSSTSRPKVSPGTSCSASSRFRAPLALICLALSTVMLTGALRISVSPNAAKSARTTRRSLSKAWSRSSSPSFAMRRGGSVGIWATARVPINRNIRSADLPMPHMTPKGSFVQVVKAGRGCSGPCIVKWPVMVTTKVLDGRGGVVRQVYAHLGALSVAL